MDNLQNRFVWAVEILKNNMEGFNNDEKITYLDDVTSYGCISGCVSGAIYNLELEKLFDNDTTDILTYLDELKEETGYNLMEDNSFHDLKIKSVWLVIEEVAREMLEEN